MALMLPSRWQKQPQGPVEIDWAHPLANGLTGLWIFNTAFPINLVSGKKSSGTKPTYSATVNGIGYGGAAVLLDDSIQNLINGVNGSILYYGVGNESSAKNFAIAGEGGTYTGISSNTSNNIQIYWNQSSPVTTNAPRDGNKKLVLSSGSTGRRLFNNGKFIQSFSAGNSNSITGNFYLTHTTVPATSACNVIAVWNRPLTDKESAEASRNIYQVLRPVRKFNSAIDPSIYNVTESIDFDLSAPEINFNGIILGAGDLLETIDTVISSPVASIDGRAGVLEGLSLRIPVDLYVTGGNFTTGRFTISGPTAGVNLNGLVGNNQGISQPLNAPIVSLDGYSGMLASFDIALPLLDASISDTPSISLQCPAPEITFNGTRGVNAGFDIGIKLSGAFTGTFGLSGAFYLPMRTGIALDGMLSGLGEIDLTIGVNISLGGYIGLTGSFDFSMPEVGTEFAGGQSPLESFSLTMPVVNITLTGINSSATELKFYNRYTR